MKLQIHWIKMDELQNYLDKYQDKIKFINFSTGQMSSVGLNSILLIIDES